MQTFTALNPWTKSETEVSIQVWKTLPSGYGHKTVTFRVDHPEHKFATPYEFKITSTDMELFDNAKDLSSDESDKLIIDTLIGDSIEIAMEIGEWLQNINERYEEEEA
jgi:hypothetical protein